MDFNKMLQYLRFCSEREKAVPISPLVVLSNNVNTAITRSGKSSSKSLYEMIVTKLNLGILTYSVSVVLGDSIRALGRVT